MESQQNEQKNKNMENPMSAMFLLAFCLVSLLVEGCDLELGVMVCTSMMIGYQSQG